MYSSIQLMRIYLFFSLCILIFFFSFVNFVHAESSGMDRDISSYLFTYILSYVPRDFFSWYPFDRAEAQNSLVSSNVQRKGRDVRSKQQDFAFRGQVGMSWTGDHPCWFIKRWIPLIAISVCFGIRTNIDDLFCSFSFGYFLERIRRQRKRRRIERKHTARKFFVKLLFSSHNLSFYFI